VGVLTFFAVLPIFLGTVLDKGKASRRAGWIKFDDLVDGDADLMD
jgi:hypothetical protein